MAATSSQWATAKWTGCQQGDSQRHSHMSTACLSVDTHTLTLSNNLSAPLKLRANRPNTASLHPNTTGGAGSIPLDLTTTSWCSFVQKGLDIGLSVCGELGGGTVCVCECMLVCPYACVLACLCVLCVCSEGGVWVQ